MSDYTFIKQFVILYEASAVTTPKPIATTVNGAKTLSSMRTLSTHVPCCRDSGVCKFL
ncbi:hypothetical protein CHS0354_007172 [Potamilus streckersoni]|uniref:Uncharacterized protein n=1 Tax=Potamilus streckersoni TaxID=2493646 RepID=A0AAE0W706_9BIVA|nr:hypothetical protein CHS0354_007172 [Potamilus streckersoni]